MNLRTISNSAHIGDENVWVRLIPSHPRDRPPTTAPRQRRVCTSAGETSETSKSRRAGDPVRQPIVRASEPRHDLITREQRGRLGTKLSPTAGRGVSIRSLPGNSSRERWPAEIHDPGAIGRDDTIDAIDKGEPRLKGTIGGRGSSRRDTRKRAPPRIRRVIQ